MSSFKGKLPKVTQEELDYAVMYVNYILIKLEKIMWKKLDYLKCPISIKYIEFAVIKHSNKKTIGPENFTGKVPQRKNNTNFTQTLPEKSQRREHFSTHSIRTL